MTNLSARSLGARRCVRLAAMGFGLAISQRAPAQVVESITVQATDHGRFAVYAPKQPRRLLALIHGTIPPGADGVDAAREFVELLQADADRRRVVLVAPAFDDANFGGHAGPGGGFRGLFGRQVRADYFLNEVIAAVQQEHPRLEPQIDLVGHSAGGQFVSRYVVMHPQRVRRAVICASGTFAFPDAAFPWAEGMAPLARTWRWGDEQPRKIEIKPDPAGWLAAAQLPITVIVGADDPTPVPEVAGQRGSNLKERSQLWVDAMNEYAKSQGQTGRVRYKLVPKAAHAMRDLLPACRTALWN